MRRSDDPARLAVRTSKNGIHLTVGNWVVSICPLREDDYDSSVNVAIWDLAGKELDATGYGAFTLDNAQKLEQVLATLRMYGNHEGGPELLAGFIRSILGMTAEEYNDHKRGVV